eukprot:CAMPEP_0194031820 /NCGR_PEP_ID=MMETSP0009_2-20130614/4897_1 /TAXON_ID=210454 /ORGANISM="Grammatophora oceanica, Strain CCMP 410" /LENGTH=302 /DNA_ID=CAMNT_0038672063 /DNA_START=13 /DNA_END=921 /DNA_ORIENTATION=+
MAPQAPAYPYRAPIRKVPLALAALCLVIVPIALFSWFPVRTTLNADERKQKLRDVHGGPQPFSGTFVGNGWKSPKTLDTKVVGETKFARLEVHSVMIDEEHNKIVNDWLFMEEANHVNIAIQMQTDKKFLVMETTKYAIPGKTLSPVGGFIDAGESPLDAAKREVMEEVGVGSPYTKEHEHDGTKWAHPNKQELEMDEYNLPIGSNNGDDPDWIFLGRYRPAANRGGGFLYTYLLKNAVPVMEHGGTPEFAGVGDDEDQSFQMLTDAELQEALLAGGFQEIKWTATMSLALQHLSTVKSEEL